MSHILNESDFPWNESDIGARHSLAAEQEQLLRDIAPDSHLHIVFEALPEFIFSSRTGRGK